MNQASLKADGALLLVTLVWGITFPVVKQAIASITPFWFLAIRFFLAAVVLALVFYGDLHYVTKKELVTGCLIGGLLFAGYAFQTFGLLFTAANKAGFITGLSVVIVPVLSSVVFKKSPPLTARLGVLAAGAGLYLLSFGFSWNVTWSPGDFLIFLCALAFATHIVAIGKFAPEMSPVVLATVQVGTTALLSALAALLFEPSLYTADSPLLKGSIWWALLFTALPATAFAFLVQNKMQRFTSTTHTALIFACEPVFAALFSYLLRGEVLTAAGWLGCGLILFGMIVAEL